MNNICNISVSDPSRSLSVQCRDVKDSDLTETVSCDPGPCPSYTWITGDWGSCIPHNTQGLYPT